MTEREKLIWAAGFIDGEGYVSVTRGKAADGKRYHYRVEISAAQVRRIPLDVLVELFGGTVRVSKDRFGQHFYWRLYCQKAVAVIERLLPYLIVKRQQASLALEFASLIDVRGKSLRYIVDVDLTRREALFAAMKQLNQRRTHAERLNEKAPTGQAEGDAIVRSHGNRNHENVVEIATSRQVS